MEFRVGRFSHCCVFLALGQLCYMQFCFYNGMDLQFSSLAFWSCSSFHLVYANQLWQYVLEAGFVTVRFVSKLDNMLNLSLFMSSWCYMDRALLHYRVFLIAETILKEVLK